MQHRGRLTQFVGRCPNQMSSSVPGFPSGPSLAIETPMPLHTMR
jgi:hypothetical protein